VVDLTEMEVKRRQGAGEQSFEAFFVSVCARARSMTARIVGSSLAEDVAVEGLARAYARWKTVARMECTFTKERKACIGSVFRQ
jgi:DNA-directed RNA polymerase specialized sigma24 family protein